MDQKQIKPTLKNPEVLFLSVLGIGFFPKAPGTLASVIIAPITYFIYQAGIPFFLFIPLIVILIFISCYIAEVAQKKYHLHDPQWIVIDEVIGMFITGLFIQNNSWPHALVLLILFRFFDIFKIWPASYLDQKVMHGYGTIMDDVVSGLYAGLTYLVGHFCFLHFIN